MSNTEPSSEEVDRQKKWFDGYLHAIEHRSVIEPPTPGVLYRCPCCGSRTLDERGGFDICPVCFWEDDGQDDSDADSVRRGPNGHLSLTQARKNFREFGACDQKSLELVRKPSPEEI